LIKQSNKYPDLFNHYFSTYKYPIILIYILENKIRTLKSDNLLVYTENAITRYHN